MLSRNLFAGVVSVVVSASLLVAVVDPAGAVEAVPSSDSLPQVVGADSPSVVVPDGPVFERPIDPLPEGDFSGVFPESTDEAGSSAGVSGPLVDVPVVEGEDPGVVVARDQFTVTRDLGDGVFVRDFSAFPVSQLGVLGAWLPIGTDFESSGDGVSVSNNPLNPVVTDSPVGAGTVSVSHDGLSLSTQLLGAMDSSLTVDSVNGSDAAVFDGAVAHGDVEIVAGTHWVKENVVLDAPGSVTSWAWRVSTTGLTLSLTADNEVVAKRADGSVVFRFVEPVAFDSRVDAAPVVLSMSLVQVTDSSYVLRVSVPREWLMDPVRVFPVTIDPTVVADFGDSNLTAYKSDGATRTDAVHVGNSRDGGTNKYWRTIVSYSVDSLAGKQVLWAQAWAAYAGAGTTSTQPGSVWTTTCSGYSCWGKEVANFSFATGSDWTGTSDTRLGALVSSWVPTATATKKLMFRGDEQSGSYTYKMLDTVLRVLYKDLPSISSTSPVNGSTTTAGPNLTVESTDPMEEGLQYKFDIFNSKSSSGGVTVDSSSLVKSSGWIEDDSYIPPFGTLDAKTYFYRVTVRDGGDKEWLIDAGLDGQKYFGVSSTDVSSYVKFTVEAGATQPVQDSVSIKPGDVVTDYTPTISVAVPASPVRPITHYQFTLTTNSDGVSGFIATTGLVALSAGASTLSWTVPAGVLHDGGQYYLTVQTAGSNGLGYPDWVTDFTLNRRLGASGPSPMEQVGGVAVNLASGNVTGSVSTPTVSTAGGPIGFTFNYNSLDESNRGLIGSYYDTTGVSDMSAWTFTGHEPLLVRQDAAVSFSYPAGTAPAPGVDSERYAVRWSGYVTLPAGVYNFGMKHNNGARVVVNGVTVLDSWRGKRYTKDVHSDTSKKITFSSTVTTVPITIDFYQSRGSAQAILFAQFLDSTPTWAPVQASNLTVEIPTLPDGWSTSTVLAGSVARYSSVDVLDNSVVVKDLSGAPHTYKKQSGGAFTPPKGEYGVLSITAASTVTLTEDDGTVYQFRSDGKLESVTPPGDSRKPAQPVMSFDSSGRVTSIADPLSVDTALNGGKNTTPSRKVSFIYKSATSDNCIDGVQPSYAPTGMLCKITYPITDGSTTAPATYIRYSGGKIAAITNPGGEATLINYAGTSTSRIPLLDQFITPFVNDMDVANVANVSAGTANFSYSTFDGNSRPKEVKLPKPSGTTDQTLMFTWGDHTTTTFLQSKPTLKHTVTYDDAWRETSSTSAMGYTTTKEWGAFDSLVRVTDGSTGLVTTRTFDQDGRVTDVYGPAPASCFAATGSALSGSCPITVARTQTLYDTTIHGLSETRFSNKNLTGSPTGFDTALADPITVSGTSQTGIQEVGTPVTGLDRGNGVRLTGLLTFDGPGDWWVKATTNQSATLTIADVEQGRVTATDPFTVQDATSSRITVITDSKNPLQKRTQRFRLDLGYLKATGTTTTLWWKHGVDGVWAPIPVTAFSPDYGLTTQSTTFDSANGVFAGHVHKSVTNYSYTTPWLGQVTATQSGDGSAMVNSTASFEAPDKVDGLNRLESTTMPTGAAENYEYYDLNQTVGTAFPGAVPCGVPSGTVIGGLLKSRTDTAGIVTQFVYDNWGRTVGSKTTGDSGWTCTTFDTRGRTTSVTTPAFGTGTAVTTTTSYAVGGDPRVTSVTDGVHTNTSTLDTLGRVVSATDSLGTVTTTSYEQGTGRVSSSTSTPVGGAAVTLAYTYDLDGKVLTITRNGVLSATVNYDTTTGRLSGVTYPNGTAVQFGYGPTGTVDSKTYLTPTGVFTESVSRSQAGRILQDVFTDPTGLVEPTTYTYDALGRLTVAELSDQTFTYGFGAVSSCPTPTQSNAGLNGNRTSQTRTVGGVSTTDAYCYDSGDRLTSASQVNGAIIYDLHGNITQLGDTSFTYDSLDRHVSTTLPTGQIILLERDIDGSVLSRTVTTPGQPTEVVKYSSGVVQFYLNSANQVTGTTQGLPGGTSVTDANSTSTTSFTSLQGNACLTVTGASTTRTRFDPFGTPLTALPDTIPGSAEPGFGTVAGKLTDTLSTFGLIEMGARLYSTVLGRFLQVDPVPGGGMNAYSYPPDPINMNDYTGAISSPTSKIIEKTNYSAVKINSDRNAKRSNSNKKIVDAIRVKDKKQTALVLNAVALGISIFAASTGVGAIAMVAAFAIGIVATKIECEVSTAVECVESMAFAFAGPMGKGLRALKVITVVDEVKFAGVVDKIELFRLARDVRKYDEEY